MVWTCVGCVWLYCRVILWSRICMVAWLYGRVVVWSRGCMVAWLYGHVVVWSRDGEVTTFAWWYCLRDWG
jgi:hypothetical protein